MALSAHIVAASELLREKHPFSAVFSELMDEWNFKANILNANPDR